MVSTSLKRSEAQIEIIAGKTIAETMIGEEMMTGDVEKPMPDDARMKQDDDESLIGSEAGRATAEPT